MPSLRGEEEKSQEEAALRDSEAALVQRRRAPRFAHAAERNDVPLRALQRHPRRPERPDGEDSTAASPP